VANVIILLSHERSGSHLLGEYLNSLENVKVYDEVCNPDAIKPLKERASFFRFRYEAVQADPSLSLEPTIEKHAAFVRSYFEYLASLRSEQTIVIDIKYGHVHNFEWCWWPILERPLLLRLCESANFGVLHLFRNNVVEAVASAMIADKTKVWHSWEASSQGGSKTIKLPAQIVARQAKLLERQNNWFKGWIGKNRKLSVTYEALAAKLGQDADFDSQLAEFVGGKRRESFSPRHQKVTRPLPEVIENYADVVRACEEAGLTEHLPSDETTKS
jgi:hypothetical protein